MNLLFISSYTGLGGGETATLALADHLPDAITPHLLVPAEGDFARAWRERGWPVHVAPWRGASVYFVPGVWAGLPIRWTIQKLITAQGIALVHSDYHTLPMALPAAKGAGVPLVWTVMGWWFRPKPWQRGFFRRAGATFAHSHAIKNGFLGEPPFMPPERVRVIYPGVDTTRFTPHQDTSETRAALGLHDDELAVLMVARFQAVKGHDTFLRTAMRVARRIDRVRFFVAGGNPHTPRDVAYQQRIRAIVEREPILRHHVRYLGHRDDIPQLIAAADVVVCPSDFESFGVVNVEAMASGVPVVSTNRGGPAETVVDDVTGYLVPPGDDAAMAACLTALLQSADTRRSFGAAGRLRVQQLFSAQAAAEQFMAGINGVLR